MSYAASPRLWRLAEGFKSVTDRKIVCRYGSRDTQAEPLLHTGCTHDDLVRIRKEDNRPRRCAHLNRNAGAVCPVFVLGEPNR